MLKKYAKRFSRSVMGGLGPGGKISGHDEVGGRARNITGTTYLSHHNASEDPSQEVPRWPPHSRKVIDDEIDDEEKEKIAQKGPLNAKGCRRTHLSSCSSNATTATNSTGEEGFGSESSLEELRMLSVMKPSGQRHRSGSRLRDGELTGKSSSLSSISSSASEGISEVVSQLRCTLLYYALVFRFVL